MSGYRIIQYRRYHDTFVTEFFLQLANVIEVSRGRIPRQQRFKEQAASLLCSLVQNFGGTVGGTAGSIGGVGVSFLGDREEGKKVTLLTSEHLSGQWHSLREMANAVATGAVGRYRDYLSKCNEEDATELGRISAQRLWEYLARTGRPFSVDDMLMGILKGKSGFLRDGLSNTKLSQGKDTAEGALKHSGIAYRDEHGEWKYTSHPAGKERYGFMLLPHAQAIVRITEKKHKHITLSEERFIALQALWEDTLEGDITQDSTLIEEDELRLKKLEQDWYDMGAWQKIVDEKLAKTEGDIAVVKDICATHGSRLDAIDIDIVETKDRVGDIENTLPEIHERAYMHGQTLKKHGDILDIQEDVLHFHDKRLLFLEQRYVSIASTDTWGHFEYPRDRCFQTREHLWSELESRFTSLEPASVVLSGAGGMGKTSLASEWAYAQKAKGHYPTVRWVNMDTSQQQNSLEIWARALQLPYEKKSVSELWAMIAQSIKEQSWLLVFDNVENYAAIQEGLSRFDLKPGQDILITSRDASTWHRPIAVDIYTQEEALNYIQLQMLAVEHPGFEKNIAHTLAERLRFHPLALELAMAFICLDQLPLKGYLGQLESQGLVSLDNATLPAQQSQARLNVHHTLSALWHNSVAKFSPDALTLLRFLSFIDPQGGARALLLKFFQNDEQRFTQALRALREQSFVKQTLSGEGNTAETWSVHRLWQEVTRGKMCDVLAQDEQAWLTHVTQNWQAVDAVFPKEIKTAEDVVAITESVAHGQAFLSHMLCISNLWSSEKKRTLHPWQANLWSRIGSGELDLARYNLAEKSLQQALAAYHEIHGATANHPEIARTLGNLGVVYYSQGNYPKAIEFHEASLVMKRAIYSATANHPEIAATLGGLGVVYNSQGNYPKAIEFHEASLVMNRAIYSATANHPEIARTLRDLTLITSTAYLTACGSSFFHSKGRKQVVQLQRTLENTSLNASEIQDAINTITLDGDMRKKYFSSINSAIAPDCTDIKLMGR